MEWLTADLVRRALLAALRAFVLVLLAALVDDELHVLPTFYVSFLNNLPRLW